MASLVDIIMGAGSKAGSIFVAIKDTGVAAGKSFYKNPW